MNGSRPALSLADLEAFDRGAPDGYIERRFLCPLCGEDKTRDAGHRSLTVRLRDGVWNCHRCQAAGKLREFWEERPALSRRDRARAGLRRAFGRPSPPRAPAPSPVE